MTDIKFSCPNCGSHLEIDATGVGMTVNCPNCNAEARVPEQDASLSTPPKISCPKCGYANLPHRFTCYQCGSVLLSSDADRLSELATRSPASCGAPLANVETKLAMPKELRCPKCGSLNISTVADKMRQLALVALIFGILTSWFC